MIIKNMMINKQFRIVYTNQNYILNKNLITKTARHSIKRTSNFLKLSYLILCIIANILDYNGLKFIQIIGHNLWLSILNY